MPGRFPDALILSTAAKQGARMVDRVARICEIAEPILGVDRAAGQHAWIRRTMQTGVLFITRDPADTMLFPRDHPRSGQDRYRWEIASNQMQYGWLVEENGNA